MIQTGFGYLSFLVVYVGAIFYISNRTKWKVFNILPPMVWIYLGSALLASFGLFARNDSVKLYQNMLTVNFLPLMLIFFLLNCDLRKIVKMGPKMLLSFFCASITIAVGFIGAFLIFRNSLPADSWGILGAASGAWFGGTANMLAAATAIGISEEGLSYAILMGSVSFTIWMVIILGSSKFGKKFNNWTKADTSIIDEVTAKLEKDNAIQKTPATFVEIISLLAIGFGTAAIASFISRYLPTFNGMVNAGTWSIILSSTAGILLAMTPVAKMKGSQVVGNVFMYIILAATGAKANFFTLADAPIYLLMGITILVIHAVTYMLFAKLFKLDLFTCEVASVANIGGVSSTPIVAGAHNPALIPIGVLMGLLGNVIGTYGALIVAQILAIL